MDQVADSFALYRFILSFALVVGGIAAIWFGYRLFASGAGTAKALDKFEFKHLQAKLSAAGMSVGAILMLTSGFWSYFAYSSFPKLAMAGDTITIANISVPTNIALGDLQRKLEVAHIIGAPVFTSGNEKIGSISHVLLGDKAKAAAIVVKTTGGPSTPNLVINPNDFAFQKMGTNLRAVLKLNKEQLLSAPYSYVVKQPE